MLKFVSEKLVQIVVDFSYDVEYRLQVMGLRTVEENFAWLDTCSFQRS
jgi:hypothetical protein